jgi:hypothetical protein
MKEQLFQLVANAATPILATNLAREYLQARILLAMQDTGAMIPLAFQGGTALRFLYDIPRFSEDLDFALERPDRAPLDLEGVERRIVSQIRSEGYEVVTRRRARRTVQSLMIGFPGILHQAGLAVHPGQHLNIRVEVDTRPPAGAGLETTIVRRHALLNLQHHDRPSLLAGKLHAVLQRSWSKGRDLFDLFWYLSDPRWPAPNPTLLKNALEQTGWQGPAIEGDSWIGALHDRVASLDWKAAERDVRPFLEPGPAATSFGRESLLSVIEARRK